MCWRGRSDYRLPCSQKKSKRANYHQVATSRLGHWNIEQIANYSIRHFRRGHAQQTGAGYTLTNILIQNYCMLLYDIILLELNAAFKL